MQAKSREGENKNKQAVWEGYSNLTWACRDQTGKAKTELELRCVGDVSSNKKVFCSTLAVEGRLLSVTEGSWQLGELHDGCNWEMSGQSSRRASWRPAEVSLTLDPRKVMAAIDPGSCSQAYKEKRSDLE